MPNVIMLALTPKELEDVVAKLANEIEAYGGAVTDDLKSAFLKAFDLAVAQDDLFLTTLATKWAAAFGRSH